MRRRLPLTLTLIALLPASAGLAACGGVPGNAVAEVDGESVEKSQFDSWMTVAAKAGGQGSGTVPEPPEYTACVADKRKAQPKPANGQKPVRDSELKDQCKQEYEAIRDRVMQLLVNAEWIEGEAAEQNVTVSDAEVRKAFETQKQQNFPKDADYKNFLKQSGQTEEQLISQVRTGELARKISEKVVKGKDKVTDAEISAYYEKNKARFAQPETRDAHVVLTRTKARAEQAKEAVESGDSWKSVANRYSVDESSKQQGGALTGVTQGTQDKGLDAALFSARRGQVVGPVKTSFGFYVLEVDKITKGSQQTLEQSKETIRQALVEEKRQKALTAFVADYEKEWRGKTECREGFKVPALCDNAPEPTPTPTPGVPGGAATPAPQD
jgi:foldase protein PrsA